MKRLYILLMVAIPLFVYAENNGVLEGQILDANTNEPISFATVVIYNTNTGTVTDLDGNFLFTGLEPGYVQVQVSNVGYTPVVSDKILVTNAKKAFLEVGIEKSNTAIEAVVVRASPFRRSDESPVSLRRIEIEQIEKNPGSNRDVSRVIQTLPGVASTPAFRNDVIVRGGGPSENRFYLDGIEIPNLNHFATQGASGGPVGIINVDFIRQVNLYSGAFPTFSSNAMSSVLDMRQIDANQEKIRFKGSIGASDMSLTLDGPITDNTSFIFSARRSYLQFLFAALELPFLPTYNDYQLKVRSRIDKKNEISIVSIGAYDVSVLNKDANETPEQKYLLNILPEDTQWNYTFGVIYKHFGDNGFHTVTASRNYLHNESIKYNNNNESDGLRFQFVSDEIENRVRYQRNLNFGNYKVAYGVSGEYAKYTRDDFQGVLSGDSVIFGSTNSFVDMYNYGAYAQASNRYFNDRLITSLGVRVDGSSYSEKMSNPFTQLSPRLSLSYILNRKLSLNFNTGRYYQRPSYTTLGYKNLENEFENRNNGITYIYSDHLVAGFEVRPNESSIMTLEGFYKHYNNYPFSLADSIPLASKGANFGTFGAEAVSSTATGRAYGFEVLMRSQDVMGIMPVLSYTYVRSEFKDLREDFFGEYIPTSWDNIHLFNLTASKNFKKGWYAGFKWRFVGGAPYTPADVELSSNVEVWDAGGFALPDYSRYNQERLKAFHQLDIRVDKEYFFDKWSLNVYVDVQNVYNFKSDTPPTWVRRSFVEPGYNDISEDGSTYELVKLQDDGGGTVLPTIGIIVEF